MENRDLNAILSVMKSQSKSLKLSNRKMKVLPNAIGRLQSLKKLDLRSNYLSDLPMEIIELKYLEELHIGNNSFTTIPKQLYAFGNLTVLQVYSNSIDFIEENTFEAFPHLIILNLNHNKMQTLPESIQWLTKLEFLSASHNEIQTLPDGLCKLKSLKELHLEYNKILYLPTEIGLLESLQKLYIHKNLLTELPESFSRLYNLRVLDIAANSLRIFPTQFCQLSIKELHYEANPLLQNAPVHSVQEEEVLTLKELTVRYVMEELQDKDSYLRISIRHFPEVKEVLRQCGRCAICNGAFLNTWLECVTFIPRDQRSGMGVKIPVRGLLCSYKCFNTGGHGYYGVAFPDPNQVSAYTTPAAER